MSEKVEKVLYKITLKVLQNKDIFNVSYYVVARNSAIAIKLCLDTHDYSTHCKYTITSIEINYISSTSYGIDKLLVEKEI